MMEISTLALRHGGKDIGYLIPPEKLIEVFARHELLALPAKVLRFNGCTPLGEDIAVDLITTHLCAVIAVEAQLLQGRPCRCRHLVFVPRSVLGEQF